MQEARTLPEEAFAVFWDRKVTLGRFKDGKIEFTQSVVDKREALAEPRGDAIFFVAWTGQWRTDLFYAKPQDLDRFLSSDKARK